MRKVFLVSLTAATVGGLALWLATPGEPMGSNRPQTITEFFGNPTAADIAAQEMALHDRVQRRIGGCMRRVGLPYAPAPYRRDGQVAGGATVLGRPNPAFRRAFGYGISTVTSMEGPSLPGVPPDPVAERKLTACRDEAYQQLLEPMEEAEEQLAPRYAELQRRIAGDHRMQEALQAWAACMKQAGHPFRAPTDIAPYLTDKVGRIQPPDQDPHQHDGRATGHHHDGVAPHQHHEGVEPHHHDEPQAGDSAPLRALQAEEMAIAASDERCRQLHINDAENQVRRELEPPFVAANKALLSRLRAEPPNSRP
jgi:hypothetical protein